MSKPTDLERATTAEASVIKLTEDLRLATEGHEKTKGELKLANDKILELGGDVTKANDARTKVEGELVTANATIADLTAKAETASKGAARILSTVGANHASTTPSGAGSTPAAGSLEDLEAKFKASTDGIERGKLAAQIRAIRERKAA